jgi:pimeloyl-ACP methyl ester carboxylesterase
MENNNENKRRTMMKQIRRDNVTLAYEEAGRGDPPLVFIHGGFADHTHFTPQFDYFKRNHRVLAMDLRGHGESDKPQQDYTMTAYADDIHWLCQQVGIKKPIVIGHSMGGLIALETAARYPDYPAGIVVMDTPIAPPAPFVEGLRQFAGALRTPMHREAVVQFLNQFIGFGDDPGRRSEVMNGMLGFAQHVGASSLESYVSYDTIAAAAACKVPILYIGAGFGFADLARFKELTPQLMVAQTVGSGHYNQLEVPDQVNAMIERFIAVSGRDAR